MVNQYSLYSKFVVAGFALLFSSLVMANDKPEWILSPERSGYISVVGYAAKQSSNSEVAQRRIALMKARQQLGQIVSVRVENNYQLVQHVANDKTNSVVDSSTRLSSHAALNLNNAEVTAQWVDPVNGDYYLLLELADGR